MVILKSVDTFAVNLSDVLFISKNSKSLISTSILGHFQIASCHCEETVNR